MIDKKIVAFLISLFLLASCVGEKPREKPTTPDGRRWQFEAELSPRAHFYVTNRLEPSGVRVIVHEDSQFIASYEISPGNIIVFPVDNLDLLRRMRAWEFSDNYDNTDIDNVEIWLDRNLENRTRRVKS